MPSISIDLERAASKGIHGNFHGPHVVPIPAFRRRKGFLLVLLVASITLVAVWNRSAIPGASSSIRWVKDSMRTNGSDQDLPLVVPAKGMSPPASTSPTSSALVAANAETNTVHGNDAFRKLAASQGFTSEETDRLADLATPHSITGPPTTEEKMLLLLQGLLNHRYRVPESRWHSQLLPETTGEFASRLAEVQGREGIDDVKLYKSDRTKWNALHREQHPLVVFSKSYCPFSKKAKALLTSLNAKFTVYEVDLRPHDAEPLQAALAAISGHKTFPAVFARGRLLGGSDDLERLNDLKVLSGILSGAGAL